MMKLMQRAEALATEAQRRRVAAIAERWRANLPGARVTVGGSEIVVEGRDLLRRWLAEPALRFAGSLRT